MQKECKFVENKRMRVRPLSKKKRKQNLYDKLKLKVVQNENNR